MLHVDDKPETLHIYVVRDEVRRPQLYPIFLSVLALASLVALTFAVPYQQPVTRAVIRVPAVLLPIRTFTATAAVIPTGIKMYPATTAHGVLTITNGSIIGQSIPAGFTVQGIATDSAVYVPGGNANGYGWAQVTAHAEIPGKNGNIPAYAINSVIGSSVYVRNLAAFSGGRDSYAVKVTTPADRSLALSKSRDLLTSSVTGLHYPCSEQVSGAVTVTWRCIFVTYSVPSYMQVTGARLVGRNVIVSILYTERPMPRRWVK
jgi:hypothetical protein